MCHFAEIQVIQSEKLIFVFPYKSNIWCDCYNNHSHVSEKKTESDLISEHEENLHHNLIKYQRKTFPFIKK